GGAMITAGMALDQNREVFAVPSPVKGARLSGTNLLIKSGKALLTESIDDIIEELGPRLSEIMTDTTRPRPEPELSLSLFEQRVLDVIHEHPTHINEVAHRCNCSCSDALVQLLSLELKGLVRQAPGKLFTRL
ncbi:MAG: DNA-processing protein DprA, partial [Bacteroidetes bacterium]|nr:DNA-processing protein DprA [Bacteroidota bacterium]